MINFVLEDLKTVFLSNRVKNYASPVTFQTIFILSQAEIESTFRTSASSE
jgi:hypothetical protein